LNSDACYCAGIVVCSETTGLSEENRTRADLQLTMDQYNKLIDVSIVHPTCSSHIKQAQTQLKTAHDACELKKNKYNKLAIP
jgi:hypothetical protein